MAVVSKEELMTSIKNLIGENTSDEAVKLIEDANDTFDSLSSATGNDELQKRIKELEDKVEETDKSWRKKYTDRFFTGGKDSPDDDNQDDLDEPTNEEDEPKTFEDLFTTE